MLRYSEFELPALCSVITGIKHKGLRRFHETGDTSKIQFQHGAKLRLILTVLEAAEDIEHIRVPAFRLHKLTGKYKGFWSVWVSGNCRVIFCFENGEAFGVDYLDYL